MNILVDNWTKGLWTAGPIGKNPAQTLTHMVNVQVMDEGTVETRPGCDLYVSLADTTDGLYVANEHFFKTSDTTVYHNADSLGFTQTGRRLRAAGMAAYGVALDLTFFPIAGKKYYDGAVYNWGITVAPSAPVATDSGVAGNLTGTYKYRLAFYNSTTNTLGALSAESASVAVTAMKVTVSSIPATCSDSQADYVRIFRTQGTVSGTYYVVGDVLLGSTTYTDNVSDSGLGDSVTNYYIAPPACTVAQRYKSRMLLFGLTENPRFCYPSLGSQPEGYNGILYEMIADAGDTVEAVVELGDYAFVFGRNSIYSMQVTTGDAIYYAKLPAGRGTLNGRTVSMGTKGIYFLSDDGVYVLDGYTPSKASLLIDSLFRGVDRGGLSTIADVDKVSANFIGGRYYLSYYGTDGQWHTVIYNEAQNRWKHYLGWVYVAAPITGTMPVVGLPGSVGVNAWDATTDNGVAYTSSCGFTLPGIPPTVLVDFRGYRISVQSAGTVQVDLYDDNVLQWSAEPLVAPTFADAYHKHSVELGRYFVQPEVRISATSDFTLKAFEAFVEPVRKTAFDYTRVLDTGTQQTGTGGE